MGRPWWGVAVSLLLLGQFMTEAHASAKARPHYPAQFLWGAALSAHQTEGEFGGGQNSDWYNFERGKNQDNKPNIENGDTAEIAADFWHRYGEDFDIAKNMGLNSIRTSVAWEKIEPAPGVFSTEAIQHYRQIFSSMRDHGIRPVIALHHFVNPQWFMDRGGWLSADSPRLFLEYATFVVAQLGDLCDLWMTFNEPVVFISMSYLQKLTPPMTGTLDAAYESAFQIARAHRMVAAMIHEKQGLSPNGRGPNGELRGVSLANAFALYDPNDPSNPNDQRVAQVMADLNNWDFVHGLLSDRLKFDIPSEVPGAKSFEREFPKDDLPAYATAPSLDWLGVNYYMRWLMQYQPTYQVRAQWITPDGPLTDNGWSIYPEGLEKVLRQTAQQFPGMPLVVSENGLSDAKDDKRPAFIRTRSGHPWLLPLESHR
jgi:beta-glucosidase